MRLPLALMVACMALVAAAGDRGSTVSAQRQLSTSSTPPQTPAPGRVNGTIRGRVELRQPPGDSPPRPNVADLGMPRQPDPADRRRSVVYLETAPRAAFDIRDEPRARIDQRNERFVPHVLAIVAGTTVDFPNNDLTYHNVFSLSKPKPFDLGRYAAGRSRSERFDRPGIVRVFCDIHSHMSAFILVFSHRYFAVTDEEGRYRLENVPPGTYTVIAWNESVPQDSRRVVVGEGGADVEVNFALARR
jgi:plastocyanin